VLTPGAVGTMVTQLAREAGAYVIGTGRVADRQKALDFGAQEFVDLENDAWKTSAASTWSSTSSAETSRSGPQA
jgi:NADPH:quinone reductase-like Zn-dependent oxidoreductase